MSTSSIKVFQVQKQGSKLVTKPVTLTKAKYEETFTEKKRAKLKAGRKARVRRDGKVLEYVGPTNKLAQAS